jgi:hypothetical protein
MSADVKVEELNCTLPNPELWGSFKVKSAEGSRLELIGWALGKGADVEQIQVVAGEKVVAATKPERPRPEIAQTMPDRPMAATCGFEVAMEAAGKGTSELRLRAILANGGESTIGTLRVVAPARRWPSFFSR